MSTHFVLKNGRTLFIPVQSITLCEQISRPLTIHPGCGTHMKFSSSLTLLRMLKKNIKIN